MTHRSDRERELSDLLTEKAAVYLGDFDEWLRSEDPDTLDYCFDLIDSLTGVLVKRPLSLSDKQARLEAFWLRLWKDMVEDYAESAAWDRERGFRAYADRRGW
jgi:hypothetical protein